MSLSASTICLMVEMGLSAEQIGRLAVAMEQEVAQATAPKPRSANAERQAQFRERRRAREEGVTRNVTDNVTTRVTPPAPSLKEIPPTPPKENIPPPTPEAHTHSARASTSDARQRLDEVREAAGDALASMATAPGISSLAQLVALTAEIPACDWGLDILPAVTTAAAWHRSQDGPGSMRSWTVAVKIARQNRTARLNPPPVEPANVRAIQTSRPSARTAASLERFEAFDAASRAALRS